MWRAWVWSVWVAASIACRTEPAPLSPSTADARTGTATEPLRTSRWALVEALSSDALAGRKPGSAAAEEARRLITDALTSCGYEVSRQQTDGPGINLLASRGAGGRTLILSAHYDHLGVVDGQIMNGADDNAAAVGSVIEVACHISKIETSGTWPVRLLVALWDTEEPPFFLTSQMGSAFFAANPTVPLADIDAVIVLDLVGAGMWPGFPAHVALGGETSAALSDAIRETPVPRGLEVLEAGLHLVERLVTNPDRRQPWSDYHAFRERHMPVLFLSNGQGHHYHRPDDDFEVLDLVKLGRQTEWLAALTQRLLQAAEKPVFSATEERPDVDIAAARRLVAAAIAHGAFDRGPLQADLERLDHDTSAMSLRRAVQRVQCYAAGQYPRPMCAHL